MTAKIFITLGLCLSLAGPGIVHASGAVLNIAAAANLTYVMPEIIKAFESEHNGITVRLSLSSTGALYSQIRNGAPYDIFLAADEERPALLYDEGFTDGEAFIYATGSIVLVSSKNIDPGNGLKALLSPEFRKIAIANPKHAPYGMAAKEAMESAGIWELLQPRLIFAENIGQAAHFVVTGSVQAGFLAESLLRNPALEGLHSYHISQENFGPILQRGVVLQRGGRASDAAITFKGFLFSERAKTIFKDFGYGVN